MENDHPIRKTAERVQHRWDRLKLATKRRLHLFDEPRIVGYRSHGSTDRLRVIGRVLEEPGVEEPEADGRVLRNIVNTIRRFESDEIPDARIVARLGGAEQTDITDHEGYFELKLRPEQELEPGWHDVELEILESMAGGAGTTGTAEVMIPSPRAGFGIISDLDDTIIRTGATDLLTEVRIVFAHSATSRSPMPGAAPLYQALEKGPAKDAANPFFYVSMSGWGLYDLFERFIDGKGFPRGAMFLQDLRVLERKSTELGHGDHKRETIEMLLADYPDLPFVLIGDSGQEDPETYLDIVRSHPDRIRAVLIRDVTPAERDREVRRIVQELQDMDIPAAAAESSVSLARAAADFDLVPGGAIDDVRRAMVESEDAEVEG